MRGKFERDAARIAYAVAHALCERQMMAVAGIEIAARLRDADDRPPRAQFRGCEPVVHEALEIERRHVDMAPELRTSRASGSVGRGLPLQPLQHRVLRQTRRNDLP